MPGSASTTRSVFVTVIVVALAGCSSHAHRVRDARHAYFSNDLSAATSLLEEAESHRPRERDCLILDRAMVALAQGAPADAESLLRDVRNRFDHLEQKDVAESSLAMLTDDTAKAYAGEDYEKVMIRAMLALSNLMQDGSDAVAYCLQVDQKQREISERAAAASPGGKPPSIANVAVGAYLRGVVQEESHLHYDDAERAFATVASWEPRFEPVKLDLARARSGVHSDSGNGVVYVFALVGRGPYKEEVLAAATSDALLIADRIVSAVGPRTLPPTIAPVKVPAIVVPANAIDSVAVDVNGRAAALTQTVTDVGRLAVAQFEAEKQEILARAIVRRVLKKAAVYATKDALAVNDGLTNLAFDAAGVVWEATEKADTRCWGLLPETIQVLRLELPAGTHQLTLRPARLGRPIGAAHTTAVEVLDGRNTYVLASFPTQNLVGKILISQSPRSPGAGHTFDRSRQAIRPVAEPSETASFMIR
ncbi:MAG: hypothetical protein O3C40_14335 [Planctomycetota bacterium]|nr:hypothetical protein [Planctomycetota bacterium]